MNDVSKPPPAWQTAGAAAAGGFIGAIGGAIVAASMLGEPDSQAKLDPPEAETQVLVAENDENS